MEPALAEEGNCVAGASTAEVLRLLSGGATGAILMALGEGPLRTMEVTERVPGYAPRTIYRYTGKLAELEVIEREEEPGVPSKVVHTLSEGCGRELYELVDRFAAASMTRLPDGRIDARAWASLDLLADLWEAGMIAELSCEPRSPAELCGGPLGLSYHQVHRRARLFKAAGLVEESEGAGRRRCFTLSGRARKAMGLIIGIADWRRNHVIAADEEGMTAAELAAALRAALPLVRLPREHAGRCLEFSVADADLDDGDAALWAGVEADGSVHSCAAGGEDLAATVRGPIGAWSAATLGGDAGRLELDGDAQLAGECLAGLHEALWSPSPF